MAISILPRARVEDEVIKRLLDYIPEGEFYLRAQYMLPILHGTGIHKFIIKGTAGHMIRLVLNDNLVARIGMVSAQEEVAVQLSLPPVVNDVEVIDEDDGSTAGLSAVITNIASVYTGAARDYFRNIYVPYLYNKWSLESPWTARHTEWWFKYHSRFPDTRDMRILSTRLNSRAVFQDAPSNVGVISQMAALTGCTPVIVPVANAGPDDWFNPGLWPLLPPQADYNGHEVNLWFPDICSAREHALLRLFDSIPSVYQLKSNIEGYQELTYNSNEWIPIRKQRVNERECNLRDLFNKIGALDYWQGFMGSSLSADIFCRFYGYLFDLSVTHPIGGGRTWDMGELLDQGNTWDTNDPWTELWDGLDVVPADVGETLDSAVQRAVCQGEVRVEPPFASEWEWTEVAVEATTLNEVSNTLHGGADPGFVG